MGCTFLICSPPVICYLCLLICLSIIIVFSGRIFRNSVVGHKCAFRWWEIEFVSERCIVCLLHRVVEIKLTYILLFSEIQSSWVIEKSLPIFCVNDQLEGLTKYPTIFLIWRYIYIYIYYIMLCWSVFDYFLEITICLFCDHLYMHTYIYIYIYIYIQTC